ARGPPDRGDDPGPVGGHLDDERRRHAEGAGPGRDAARRVEGASPAEPVRRQDRVRGVADDRAAPAGDRARPSVGGPERRLELIGGTGTRERGSGWLRQRRWRKRSGPGRRAWSSRAATPG